MRIRIFGWLMLLLTGLPIRSVLAAQEPEKPLGGTSQRTAHAPVVFVREPGPQVNKSACLAETILPNANVPLWDSQAMTTQCGVLENDILATWQTMANGVVQVVTVNTAKYGITPRMELRWGMPGRIAQSSNRRKIQGATDQWLGVLYRFHEGAGRLPDLALDYALKVPMANPAKGLGTGYVDGALTFVASRDIRRNHADFNMVVTVVGGPAGSDSAVQFGMAVTRPLPHRLMCTLEAYGGPQPGTTDRYGAVLAGGAWGMRPWLAVNAAYARAYTGGSPRDQLMMGIIYTLRPRLPR